MAGQDLPQRSTPHVARAPAPERRAGHGGEAAEAKGRPGRSTVRRLAAEVERLQAELAAMRDKVADLETKVDVDPLLGIFNRRGFARELSRALSFVARYDTRAALVYLDLDGFKAVNDLHGHAAGDTLLKSVAVTLTASVRASDSVARLGGDEFAVLLWNLGEGEVAAKALSLEQRIAAGEVMWDGRRLAVGASAGFTVLARGDEAPAVLARADRAMYARKAERTRGG